MLTDCVLELFLLFLFVLLLLIFVFLLLPQLGRSLLLCLSLLSSLFLKLLALFLAQGFPLRDIVLALFLERGRLRRQLFLGAALS